MRIGDYYTLSGREREGDVLCCNNISLYVLFTVQFPFFRIYTNKVLNLERDSMEIEFRIFVQPCTSSEMSVILSSSLLFAYTSLHIILVCKKIEEKIKLLSISHQPLKSLYHEQVRHVCVQYVILRTLKIVLKHIVFKNAFLASSLQK